MTDSAATTDTEFDFSANGIAKSFSTVGGSLSILSDFQLDLRRGDAVSITGPSGSGKSTFLYIAGLLSEPDAGTLRILEESDPFKLDEAAQARFRNEYIGFIFQDHHLLPQCTVLENILLPTLPHAPVTEDLTERAQSLLKQVGLADRMTHRPAQLSGGERQRVAVCRALINRPALVLADEPTGNLDHSRADEIGDTLLKLCSEENTMLVCVTHSTELANRFPLRKELFEGKLQDRA